MKKRLKKGGRGGTRRRKRRGREKGKDKAKNQRVRRRYWRNQTSEEMVNDGIVGQGKEENKKWKENNGYQTWEKIENDGNVGQGKEEKAEKKIVKKINLGRNGKRWSCKTTNRRKRWEKNNEEIKVGKKWKTMTICKFMLLYFKVCTVRLSVSHVHL